MVVMDDSTHKHDYSAIVTSWAKLQQYGLDLEEINRAVAATCQARANTLHTPIARWFTGNVKQKRYFFTVMFEQMVEIADCDELEFRVFTRHVADYHARIGCSREMWMMMRDELYPILHHLAELKLPAGIWQLEETLMWKRYLDKFCLAASKRKAWNDLESQSILLSAHSRRNGQDTVSSKKVIFSRPRSIRPASTRSSLKSDTISPTNRSNAFGISVFAPPKSSNAATLASPIHLGVGDAASTRIKDVFTNSETSDNIVAYCNQDNGSQGNPAPLLHPHVVLHVPDSSRSAQSHLTDTQRIASFQKKMESISKSFKQNPALSPAAFSSPLPPFGTEIDSRILPSSKSQSKLGFFPTPAISLSPSARDAKSNHSKLSFSRNSQDQEKFSPSPPHVSPVPHHTEASAIGRTRATVSQKSVTGDTSSVTSSSFVPMQSFSAPGAYYAPYSRLPSVPTHPLYPVSVIYVPTVQAPNGEFYPIVNATNALPQDPNISFQLQKLHQMQMDLIHNQTLLSNYVPASQRSNFSAESIKLMGRSDARFTNFFTDQSQSVATSTRKKTNGPVSQPLNAN